MPSSAQQAVSKGVKDLIAALLPSKHERRQMHCVVEAVSNAIATAPQSGAWTVVRAKSVGSFEKRTNLAGT
jgi:tRNA nucleotidyltransferase (CCA-adding enzyme)